MQPEQPPKLIDDAPTPAYSEFADTPYRVLARTGARVSAIGLGGWHIGLKTVSEALSIRVIDAAIDRGINFLDNSWDYNDGTPPPNRVRAAGHGAVPRHHPGEHRLRTSRCATKAQIVSAAKLANADEFVARVLGNYDAPIGQRGITLSGGQGQRIGIARALIYHAPILILDEPTASLDTESEELVMEGLQHLMNGRTVIMITHPLNTIRDADAIVVLHNGTVAERGTHQDLLALGGIYADLYTTTMAQPPESELAWRAH